MINTSRANDFIYRNSRSINAPVCIFEINLPLSSVATTLKQFNKRLMRNSEKNETRLIDININLIDYSHPCAHTFRELRKHEKDTGEK